MTTATVKDVERLSKTSRPFVDAWLIAKAHAELTREKIDGIKREVLDFIDARDEEGNRITDPKSDYRLPEGAWRGYLDELHKRYVAAGYKVEQDYCPALIAEDVLRKAEHLLIDHAGPTFGFTVDNLICSGLKNYRKFIDLTVGLVVSRSDYRSPLAA